MCRVQSILLISVLLFLTSCFEIREEIIIRTDGTGTYSMVLDFSESDTMLGQLLESVKENNEVSISQNPFEVIDSTFEEGASDLNAILGINNAQGVREGDFAYGIQFDFDNVNALNIALAQTNVEGDNFEFKQYYKFSKKTLERTDYFNLDKLTDNIVPENASIQNNSDIAEKLETLYQSAKYSFIVRTSGKIKSYTNLDAKLSYDKKKLTYNKTMKELKSDNNDLSNIIRIK